MKSSKSKKRSRNQKTISSQTEPVSQSGCSQSPLALAETLPSTSQLRSTDLAGLSEAFSSLSVDQIESAYEAAGILGTHLEDVSSGIKGPTVNDDGPAHKKSSKARRRQVVVSCGMVSSVIGKRLQPEMKETNIIQGEGHVDSKNGENAERFLCSVLGEDSELDLDTVRDIFGNKI
jgi:hypothetical protein